MDYHWDFTPADCDARRGRVVAVQTCELDRGQRFRLQVRQAFAHHEVHRVAKDFDTSKRAV